MAAEVVKELRKAIEEVNSKVDQVIDKVRDQDKGTEERNKIIYEDGLNTVTYEVIKKEKIEKDIDKIIIKT